MEPSASIDPLRVEVILARVLGPVEQLAEHTCQFGRVIGLLATTDTE